LLPNTKASFSLFSSFVSISSSTFLLSSISFVSVSFLSSLTPNPVSAENVFGISKETGPELPKVKDVASFFGSFSSHLASLVSFFTLSPTWFSFLAMEAKEKLSAWDCWPNVKGLLVAALLLKLKFSSDFFLIVSSFPLVNGVGDAGFGGFPKVKVTFGGESIFLLLNATSPSLEEFPPENVVEMEMRELEVPSLSVSTEGNKGEISELFVPKENNVLLVEPSGFNPDCVLSTEPKVFSFLVSEEPNTNSLEEAFSVSISIFVSASKSASGVRIFGVWIVGTSVSELLSVSSLLIEPPKTIPASVAPIFAINSEFGERYVLSGLESDCLAKIVAGDSGFINGALSELSELSSLDESTWSLAAKCVLSFVGE